ncbi:MAG: hypothetical protein Q7S40_09790 [Opitutaceae bacterium]|nr:hypothetical protein [Opitutaceae bacterium]
MIPDDELFQHPGQIAWASEDLDFAVKELVKEFPAASRDSLVAAVNSATPFLPSIAGRVKLMQRARERLRAGHAT